MIRELTGSMNMLGLEAHYKARNKAAHAAAELCPFRTRIDCGL